MQAPLITNDYAFTQNYRLRENMPISRYIRIQKDDGSFVDFTGCEAKMSLKFGNEIVGTYAVGSGFTVREDDPTYLLYTFDLKLKPFAYSYDMWINVSEQFYYKKGIYLIVPNITEP